jgi:hypothetical protein
MVEYVVRVLARGAEPTIKDLAAALREAADAQKPIPPELGAYAAKVIDGRSRKPGPRTPARTAWEEAEMVVFYYVELAAAKDRHAYDESPKTRDVVTRAKKLTADAFGVSVRTVTNVLNARPVFKLPTK